MAINMWVVGLTSNEMDLANYISLMDNTTRGYG
jgi:hypothetical protein